MAKFLDFKCTAILSNHIIQNTALSSYTAKHNFVFNQFFSLLNHCYWERNVCFIHEDFQMFGVKLNKYE